MSCKPLATVVLIALIVAGCEDRASHSATASDATGAVRVSVTDVAGAPVHPADVDLLVEREGETSTLRSGTNAHGSARFQSPAPASVRAYAWNGHSAGSTPPMFLPANGRIDLELTVRPSRDFAMLPTASTGNGSAELELP